MAGSRSLLPNPNWTTSEYLDIPTSGEQGQVQSIGCVRCAKEDPAPPRVYIVNGISMCYDHAHAQDFRNQAEEYNV